MWPADHHIADDPVGPLQLADFVVAHDELLYPVQCGFASGVLDRFIDHIGFLAVVAGVLLVACAL
jgi:hypothetical protein